MSSSRSGCTPSPLEAVKDQECVEGIASLKRVPALYIFTAAYNT
jgi:hypothetical protein